MTPRERLQLTLEHKDPGKVVVDMGGTAVTGISAKALSNLRKALHLPEQLVKVHEPFQMLGSVDEDIRRALDIDIVGVGGINNIFGFKNDGWKPWKMSDGNEVLVGEKFYTSSDEVGNTYLYPKGNTSVPASGKMPKGGFYFDNIVRQDEIDEDAMNPREDYKDDFQLFSEEELRYFEETTDYYYKNTDYGIFGHGSFMSLGDFCPLPGPGLEKTKGIRKPEDWIVAHYQYPEYVKETYEFQLEMALKNLELYKQAVGNKVQAIFISGTDFGTQRCEMISRDFFREFYKPYFKVVNDWVHQNTNWKTFYHSCGSIVNLLDEFVEAGCDILNPVQCSAQGMNPKMLKEKYGDKLVFWGGGIDTQNVMQFGTPEEVYEEVRGRLKIFAPGGGFVFNTVHNIQWATPTDNIVAMFKAIKDYNNTVK
ncbi:MAG: hypothetical protein K0S71_1180 [Clostridia bacterium]|jgi:hypothetical protein|nr:hypothetical protein [Clostridia bacterium]